MAVNVFGVVGIVLFYVIILVIGLWAARKRGQQDVEATSEEVMLAGRSIGTFVGTFTMTATWVGGGYINGTAEVVNKRGLIWAQSGWGYALSLILGGILFAKIMRQQGYVTMLDPFQQRYGTRVGGIMYVPAFLGELLWSAATLNSLGATISVVFDLDKKISVIVSACVAILYTVLGGLWSVAFTDVAQLICMFIGMWLTIPFALTHEAVASISETVTGWTGNASAAIFQSAMFKSGARMYSLPVSNITNNTLGSQWRWGEKGWKGEWEWSQFGVWLDYAFLLIFGGIPWQVYFQRVLSSKTYSQAQFLSHAAACGCIFMVIPPTLIGAIGYSTDWSLTGYASTFTEQNMTLDYQQTMPLVLQYLTPPGVSFIGLGAVSAAVMSSVDSSVLSASSMFANNIYKAILRQNASETEILWVIRVAILVVGFIATLIGLTTQTIYGLSILCSDLIFVILFPQLLCVIYFRYSNAYGAVTSFFFGMLVRLLSGEELIGLPAVLKFPGFSESSKEQLFPFRLFTMLITLIVLGLASFTFHMLFRRQIIPRRYDIANAFGTEEIPPFSFFDMLKTDGVITKKGNADVLMVERCDADSKEIDQNGNGETLPAQNEKLVNFVDT